jgi:hypothetical protein
MKRRTLLGVSRVLWCAALLSLAVPAAHARAKGAARQREGSQVDATVVGIGGRFSGRARPFTLRIERFTSTDEVQRLNSALQSGGQDELLRVLSGMKAGRIAIGNNVGVDASAIISVPTPDGGTRLIVLFERTVGFYELRAGARSTDYRFGYAEIILDRDGRGEGTFIPVARVRLRDGNTWEVEDFGVFPARLMGLRASGRVTPG